MISTVNSLISELSCYDLDNDLPPYVDPIPPGYPFPLKQDAHAHWGRVGQRI